MPAAPRKPRSDVGVLTVDDHEAFLQAAQEVVEATPGFELLAHARCGSEALALADRVSPDLVLVDVRMSGLDGYETSRRLRAAHPRAIIVLVSAEEIVEASRQSCGATASLRKTGFGPAALRRIWDVHGSPPP